MSYKNEEPLLSPKLERRLRGLIYHHADGLMSDKIKEEFFGDDERSFQSFHYLYNFRRILRDRESANSKKSLSETWAKYFRDSEDIAQKSQDDLDDESRALLASIEQAIYDDIVSFFSALTMDEAQSLTPRQRRERVRAIQDGQAEDFKQISLKGYLPHFIRYLCNAPPKTQEGSWQDAAWPREDWDSDAIMIIRGHMISKSLRSGKGIHLDAPQITDVKAQAAKYVPKEGGAYTRIALSMMDGLDQEELPEIWRFDDADHKAVVMHPDLAGEMDNEGKPQAQILHADDNYILLQLKNLPAALAFGSRE